MIENLINKLIKAETVDEILSYKSLILDTYDSLYEEMQSESCFRTNFDDIKALHDLEIPMMAYYGPCFYERCGIPFIKEHNPETIHILELTVLFYTIQVMNLLENDFYSDIGLFIYNTSSETVEVECIEDIDLINYIDKENLFLRLWFCFMQVITIEDSGREFTMEHDFNIDTFYLTDEKYEEVLDMIYRDYEGSNFSHIMDRIIGRYKLRFTKMEYILKYQPLFVKVGYEYLCTLIKR